MPTLTKTAQKAMTKWLRDLERAYIKRDRAKILSLYDENKDNPAFDWEQADADMQQDYEDFTNRANNIVYC